MSETSMWMCLFVGAYLFWCVIGGVVASFQIHAPKDFFIAGRQLSAGTYLFAVTAATFSAWAFLGHPGILFRDSGCSADDLGL